LALVGRVLGMTQRECPKCGGYKNRKSNQCAACSGYGRGRSVMTNGYIRVWRPGHPMANRDGYALEHRVVLYDAGIPVPKGAHVHHRNEDKADNRLANLAVLPVVAHVRHHARVNGVVNQYGRWPLREAS
jgi:hypothetical protein